MNMKESDIVDPAERALEAYKLSVYYCIHILRAREHIYNFKIIIIKFVLLGSFTFENKLLYS